MSEQQTEEARKPWRPLRHRLAALADEWETAEPDTAYSGKDYAAMLRAVLFPHADRSE